MTDVCGFVEFVEILLKKVLTVFKYAHIISLMLNFVGKEGMMLQYSHGVLFRPGETSDSSKMRRLPPPPIV